MKIIFTSVKRKVWGFEDEYFVVEAQVDGSEFKAGDKVKVTIEKI